MNISKVKKIEQTKPKGVSDENARWYWIVINATVEEIWKRGRTSEKTQSPS